MPTLVADWLSRSRQWLLALFAALASAPALATKCTMPGPDLPPPTAAEQRLLDAHEMAVQRTELDRQSAIAADPLLGPLVEPWEILQDDDVTAEAKTVLLRPWLQRDEIMALFLVSGAIGELYDDEESPHPMVQIDALAQRWRAGAPLWSLLIAMKQWQAGADAATDQSLREFVARIGQSGRLSVTVRRLGLRWFGLLRQLPEPEHPLPDRAYGCSDAIGLAMALPFVLDIEAMTAYMLVEDSAFGQICPEPDEVLLPEDTPTRLSLCAAVRTAVARQPVVVAMEKDDSDVDWWESCEQQIEQAAAATDWRVALDQLAWRGCALPEPGSEDLSTD
jgi:hypothetical protein